jgi:hypothetical protein
MIADVIRKAAIYPEFLSKWPYVLVHDCKVLSESLGILFLINPLINIQLSFNFQSLFMYFTLVGLTVIPSRVSWEHSEVITQLLHRQGFPRMHPEEVLVGRLLNIAMAGDCHYITFMSNSVQQNIISWFVTRNFTGSYLNLTTKICYKNMPV